MRRLLALAVLLSLLPAAPAAAQRPALVPTVSKLTLNGIGGLRFGMTEEQVDAAVGTISYRVLEVGDCRYFDFGPPGTPQGPVLRFQDGELVHVSVGRRGFRTPANVGYRSPVRTVRRKYPGARRVASLGGGYALEWAPRSGGDRRYLFFIAGGRVQQAVSGVLPYVRQQECS